MGDKPMFDTLKRLALGMALIALASGVLLYTDRGSRNRSRNASSTVQPRKMYRVAVVTHASLEVLEQGLEGMLAELAERGYEDGKRLEIHRYNAEGDIGTPTRLPRKSPPAAST
jgi:ABC-type uncharacterized transport system substrate-binding protein